MKKTIFILAVLLLFAGCTNAPQAEKNTISVSSTGTVKDIPDNAVVSFSVVTQDKEAKGALDNNSQLMGKVVSALESMGIDKKDIKTTSVNVYPEYEDVKTEEINGKQRKIVGYNAYNSVEVTVRDVEDTGSVIDGALGAGANQVQNLYFKFSPEKDRELYQEALKEAVVDAKGKAAVLADAMGVEIVRPFRITESGPSYPVFFRTAAEMADGASTPVSPGELEVTATVSIEYEIG